MDHVHRSVCPSQDVEKPLKPPQEEVDVFMRVAKMSVGYTGGADISSQIIICLFCMRIYCDILSFKYVLPDARRIKRINKDMQLILYSPGIWVTHRISTHAAHIGTRHDIVGLPL